MDDQLKKKLAHYIAGMSFNYETYSTLGVLEGMGLDVTMDDAADITDIASDLFDAMMKKSEGWKALAIKQGKLLKK